MLEKNRNNKKNSRDLPIINERIKFDRVRVIREDGSQLGIITHNKALNMAKQEGLDLVLVSDKSNPPVCKIIDYGKYKFTQEKKAKEARKKQHNVNLKEVKMRYKIEEHDYQVRINQASKFILSGDKVKATITFRGREIQHTNLAIELLNRMTSDLSKIAEVQQKPSRDGKNMIMILSPRKIRHS